MNHFSKVASLDFVFDILAMFKKLNQGECYKSKMCQSQCCFLFKYPCPPLCAVQMWPQHAELLIPSEITTMLRHFVLFLPPQHLQPCASYTQGMPVMLRRRGTRRESTPSERERPWSSPVWWRGILDHRLGTRYLFVRPLLTARAKIATQGNHGTRF